MRINMIGKTIGRLKVLKQAGYYPGNGEAIWLCQCECGSLTEIRGQYLRDEITVSCGCFRDDVLSELREKHGLAKDNHPLNYLYHIWQRIRKQPMTNVWRNDPVAFVKTVGERPTPKHALARIDRDLPWQPNNTIWITQREIRYRTLYNKLKKLNKYDPKLNIYRDKLISCCLVP